MFELIMPDPARRARMTILLGILDLDTTRLRPRDAWVELVGDRLQIALYTRVGGGNREDYVGPIRAAQAHPGYLSDRDDGFDPTYATFRFAWPTERADGLLAAQAPSPGRSMTELARASALAGERDTDQMWRDAQARFAAGDISPGQVAMVDQLTAGIRAALSGEGPPIVEV